MILFVPLLAIGAIAVTFLAGLLFSLIAATSCAVLAMRRDLSVKRYALAGGIYSALLIAPYVYLAARLLDRKPSEELVRFTYLVLIGLWIAGPLFATGGYAGYHIAGGNPWEANTLPIIVGMGFAAIVNSIMLGSWLLWIRRRKPAPASDDLLPHVGYVLPFPMAIFGTLLFYAMNWINELFFVT